MACGVPVIATKNGGSETIITGDTGILIEPANKYQLAEAMQRRILDEIIFDSKKIRNHIINNWGYKNILDKYIKIWEEIGISTV